jgi:phage tail-like protein
MRPQGATHWLLDRATGWRAGVRDHVAEGADLRLAHEFTGPFGFGAEDGSLGGLVMPVGFALTRDGICYLLDPDGTVVRRFDPEAQRFITVLGRGRPELRGVVNIAITGRSLYVVEPRRVRVFGLPDLELRHVWTGDWDLVDVSTDGTTTYLLDRRRAEVRSHRPDDAETRLVFRDAVYSGQWNRVAVDRDGIVHLHDPQRRLLHSYDRDGCRIGTVTDPAQVRDRFTAPPLRLVAGVFVLPPGLTRPCDRHAEPDLGGVSAEPRAAVDGLAFDRSGSSVPRPRASRGPRPYALEGTWTTTALDSRIHRCVWDRVELDVAALPAATSIVVETASGDTADGPRDWVIAGEQSGRAHAPGQPAESMVLDWPVRSAPGRYLAVRLTLRGPGRATPVVGALRVRYPRSSYLEFLPAEFGAEPESRDFLERFLGVAQTEWDGLSARIGDLPRLVDPRAVPAGAPLRFLANWVGVPLDGRWSEQQQRRWLLASLKVLHRRGTPIGVRELLAALVANLTGVETTERSYPLLVEGFRARRRLSLGEPFGSTVDAASKVPLWSPDVVGRLRTGTYAQVGKARLVSTGDPAHDLFTSTAHSFRVYLPSSWVRTAEDERVVRRLLAAERPATTRYDLCLVEPRLRVGSQSTVGLDTIVGAVPTARLACTHETDAAPSRPPRYRLGMDSVLAQAAPQHTLRIGATTRIGVGSAIT